jgi:hypothetical protein
VGLRLEIACEVRRRASNDIGFRRFSLAFALAEREDTCSGAGACSGGPSGSLETLGRFVGLDGKSVAVTKDNGSFAWAALKLSCLSAFGESYGALRPSEPGLSVAGDLYDGSIKGLF